jgi:biopolymer transport protein ExbD
MSMSAGGGGGVKAEPNVTPMIDVMLVLLIIFMIVIPTIEAGFTAVPPQGINLKPQQEADDDQVLGIDAAGNYYLNKKAIHPDNVLGALKAIYDVRTVDKILYVKAHKELDYGKIQDALALAAEAGVRKTGMISEQVPNTESTVVGDIPATAGGAPAAPPGGSR